MQPFTTLTSRAACLPGANIDTDVIIRVEHLTGTPRSELGKHAFAALRYRPDGGEHADFPLSAARRGDAAILIAGPNFGCGSSREAAVWALMGLGIRCVIAPSFGDIFHDNCFQNGVLAIRLDGNACGAQAERAHAGGLITVDLRRCEILAHDGTAHGFVVDPPHREALLCGLDAIELTRRDQAGIAAWQAADIRRRPWVWNAPRFSGD